MKNLVLGLAVVGAMLAAGGCRTTYSSHQLNEQRVVAKYGGRTLYADLPAEIRVPAVMAAADEVVRSRGYTVHGNVSTEETGTHTSVPPGKDSLNRLVVSAEKGDHGTAVRVAYQPFPDRQLCESIFDAILAKLTAQ